MSFLASAMTVMNTEAEQSAGSEQNETFDFDDPGVQPCVVLSSQTSSQRIGDPSCSQAQRQLLNNDERYEQDMKRTHIIFIADIMDKLRHKSQAGNLKIVSKTSNNNSVNSSSMKKVKGRLSFIDSDCSISAPSENLNYDEEDCSESMPPQKHYVSPMEYEEKNTIDDGSLLESLVSNHNGNLSHGDDGENDVVSNQVVVDVNVNPMSYRARSVVAGETTTCAKFNETPDNDSRAQKKKNKFNVKTSLQTNHSQETVGSPRPTSLVKFAGLTNVDEVNDGEGYLHNTTNLLVKAQSSRYRSTLAARTPKSSVNKPSKRRRAAKRKQLLTGDDGSADGSSHLLPVITIDSCTPNSLQSELIDVDVNMGFSGDSSDVTVYNGGDDIDPRRCNSNSKCASLLMEEEGEDDEDDESFNGSKHQAASLINVSSSSTSKARVLSLSSLRKRRARAAKIKKRRDCALLAQRKLEKADVEARLEKDEFYKLLDADSDELKVAFQAQIIKSFPDVLTTDPNSIDSLLYLNDIDRRSKKDWKVDADVLKAFISNIQTKLVKGKSVWLALDTGANQHILKDCQLIKNKRTTLQRVVGVSGESTNLEFVGDAELFLEDCDGKKHSLDIVEAFGMSSCPYNLISVSKLLDDKCNLHLYGDGSKTSHLELPLSHIKIPIVRKHGLFLLQTHVNVDNQSQHGGAYIHESVAFHGSVTEVDASVSEHDHTDIADTTCSLKVSPDEHISVISAHKDYGGTAPLGLWHLRNRHLSLATLKTIHSFSQKVLQAEHAARLSILEKQKLGDGEMGGDVIDAVDDVVLDKIDDDRRCSSDEACLYGYRFTQDPKKLKRPSCDVCNQAKARKKGQKSRRDNPEPDLKQGRVFSCDVKVVSCKSFHGHKYVLCFVEHVDGLPGIVFHYNMRHKSEGATKLQVFIDDCKRLGIKIARIQSDRGSEFFEQEGIGKHFDLRDLHKFGIICENHGIRHTVTSVGDHDNYAERWIKEHFKTVDVYLWNGRLAPQFWTYALDYSVYQYNRTPKLIGDTWFKAPHHYWTGEVPNWDKWKVFGCDAFAIIPNNKYRKYPGIPSAQRSIFVGFDHNGGTLLFDMNKRRHFHSTNVCCNEDFSQRHNALHTFDQRRALLDKDLNQPLQMNDFDALQTTQVRNLFINAAELKAVETAQLKQSNSSWSTQAIGQQSTNTGIGGECPTVSGVIHTGRLNSNRTHDTYVNGSMPSISDDLHNQIETIERHGVVRPLRLLPVGIEEDNTDEHKLFLKNADQFNYPCVMLQQCPKRSGSHSASRYLKSMSGTTIKEIKTLGSTSADVLWNFLRGYIIFPGHESKQSGHIFSATVGHNARNSDGSIKSSFRYKAFNKALTVIDEEFDEREMEALLDDSIRASAFAQDRANMLMALAARSTARPGQAHINWHIAAEPVHYNETTKDRCTEHAEWKEAMDEELESMRMFDVYSVMDIKDIPKGRQVLGCKWVYKRKRDMDGHIVRYRARVVALGYRQLAYDSFIPEETYFTRGFERHSQNVFVHLCEAKLSNIPSRC